MNNADTDRAEFLAPAKTISAKEEIHAEGLPTTSDVYEVVSVETVKTSQDTCISSCENLAVKQGWAYELSRMGLGEAAVFRILRSEFNARRD